MSVAQRAALKLLPRKRVNWQKFDRIFRNWEIWQDKESVVQRLPEHYKERYWRELMKDKTPVHYEGPRERYTWDDKKNIWQENEDNPPEVLPCPESDFGLWGGEGILKTFKLSRPFTRKKVLPRHWVPRLYFPDPKWVVLYSEILDAYMKIRVTERTMRLIDANHGIDNYLLRTSDLDLDSRLGRKLKRELLISLATKAYHPTDPKKRKEITRKYAEFVIPLSEASWVGLDLNEASRKQQDIEAAQTPIPQKLDLEYEYLEKIRKELKLAEEMPQEKKSIWKW